MEAGGRSREEEGGLCRREAGVRALNLTEYYIRHPVMSLVLRWAPRRLSERENPPPSHYYTAVMGTPAAANIR